MKVRLALLMIFPLLAACEPLKEVDGTFAIYNAHPDPHQVIVDSKNIGPVFAFGEHDRIKGTILVPRSDPYGPSEYDAIIRVQIGAQNMRTKALVPLIECDAGAKVVTNIEIYMNADGITKIRCPDGGWGWW
jgi:hypothetical protein